VMRQVALRIAQLLINNSCSNDARSNARTPKL
jgi:hypothetical protein